MKSGIFHSGKIVIFLFISIFGVRYDFTLSSIDSIARALFSRMSSSSKKSSRYRFNVLYIWAIVSSKTDKIDTFDFSIRSRAKRHAAKRTGLGFSGDIKPSTAFAISC